MQRIDYDSLNPEQRSAVLHEGGPLAIFAGAGSGKTRVITYRIAHLIERGVRPSSIFAVTFTNKAAREMRERVESLVGDSARGIWLGTFHSMCGRILRESGHLIGVDRNFTIYDDSDQVSLVRAIIKKLDISDRSITPRAVLSEISRAKEKQISPEAYAKDAMSGFESYVADIYPEYVEQLRKNRALDFDDMVLFALKLLKERADARQAYQQRFQHILVDEFQDVNQSQYGLVMLLGEEHKNITIVGDDDQSIYSWRGADVSLILQFSKQLPDVTVVTLERNYRSTKRILQAAHEVIKHNRSRAPKILRTDNEAGVPVTLTEVGTPRDEAMLIANVIQTGVAEGGRKYGHYAILFRTNAQSREFEEVFRSARIPHVVIGGQRFYERKEIKDMLAYLKVTANPNDTVSLLRVVNEPPRGIGTVTLTKLEEHAQAIPLWDALQSGEFQQALNQKQADAIKKFIRCIQRAREIAESGRVAPVLFELQKGSGYADALRAEDTHESRARLENLQELLNAAQRYDEEPGEHDLVTYLQEISLLSDIDQLIESEDAVSLMTAHSAKGLEFPIVFVAGLEEGVFPHSRSLSAVRGIEEERRLCYVAMTRAREQLHLTWCVHRQQMGFSTSPQLSQFVQQIPTELLTTLVERPKLESARPRTQSVSAYEYQRAQHGRVPSANTETAWNPPFEVGTQVRHPEFGVGFVVHCIPVQDDSEITVAFPGIHGTKKLMNRYARLEKA